ncbi:MAG: hypothetical protein JJV88_03065, partial [Sulfurovum sp.]|nr:hypothetical protein [Sulfurovaceae bacterium]
DNRFNYIAFLLADNNNISIKVAKYSGVDKVDLIENEEYGFSSLVKATKSVLDKLDIENRTFTKITGNAQRFQKDMIDKTALREALINAMVHNDYSREFFPVVEIYKDRLTITSYGGLVDGLDFDEMLKGRSMPRSRELMRVFRDLDLVEHLGSGVNRILKGYSQDVFDISNHFFEVCFRFKEATVDKRRIPPNTAELSQNELIVIDYLNKNNTIESAQVEQLCNIKERRTREILSNLVKEGYLQKIGKTKGSYYILAQGGRDE